MKIYKSPKDGRTKISFSQKDVEKALGGLGKAIGFGAGIVQSELAHQRREQEKLNGRLDQLMDRMIEAAFRK